MYYVFLKGNNPTQRFLITLAFRSGGDTKSDFSLTEGRKEQNETNFLCKVTHFPDITQCNYLF